MPYADRERRREASREARRRRRKTPEGKAQNVREQSAWRKRNPQKARAMDRRKELKKLGWTPEMVEATRVEQGNRCAICREPFVATPHSDHKHVTPPEPRGLLCGTCNRGLGIFLDSPETLRAAADYLDAWS